MKKLYFLMFLLFTLSLNAQSELIMLLSDEAEFNPNFDGNVLVWYDGNVGLTSTDWKDQSGDNHHIVFSNTPTIVSNATPLCDAVRFDGINQFGVVATPALDQPFTIYVVVKQITWVNFKTIYADGVSGSVYNLLQRTASPNMGIAALTNLNSFPDLAVGTWGVITTVINNLSGEIRTNLSTTVVGTVGANNGDGIAIGALTGGANFSNCEIGYLIIRTGADDTATQNIIINGLKKVCGLTF